MRTTESANTTAGLSEAQLQRVLQIKAQIEKLEAEMEAILRKPETERAVVELARRRPTFAEAMAAIESSPLRFTKSWDEIKEETR